MRDLRVLVFVLATAATAVAFRAGGLALWVLYAGGLALAAAAALVALARDAILRDVFRRKGFDLATGILVGVALYALVWLAYFRLVAPPDVALGLLRKCGLDGARFPRPDAAPALEWVRNRVCVDYGRSLGLLGPRRGVAVVAIAALEEVAWRGGVQQALSEKLGSTRGWLAASALYALAQAATGSALVAALALAGGLAWGALYRYRGRLPPAIAAHAVFSYALLYTMPLAQFT